MIRNIAFAVPVCLFVLSSNAIAHDAVDLAAQLIGRPYVWGAEGPKAFDCSGLTQFVYQEVGIALPRRAINQSTFGDATRGGDRDSPSRSSGRRQAAIRVLETIAGELLKRPRN